MSWHLIVPTPNPPSPLPPSLPPKTNSFPLPSTSKNKRNIAPKGIPKDTSTTTGSTIRMWHLRWVPPPQVSPATKRVRHPERQPPKNRNPIPPNPNPQPSAIGPPTPPPPTHQLPTTPTLSLVPGGQNDPPSQNSNPKNNENRIVESYLSCLPTVVELAKIRRLKRS